MSKSFKIGRDAITGQFKPIGYAVKRPSTTVVETIRIPTTSKRK